jgi:GT2 family glycosyltransferase
MAKSKSSSEWSHLPEDFIPGKIGIVTVTYNSSAVLCDLFESLDRQTYRNFLLISIDNASQDASLEMLHSYRGFEHFIISNSENLGVAAGNNQGILAAIENGCEYVLLLNNDVTFGPELIKQLVAGLSVEGRDMVAPIIYYHDRPDIIWAAGGRFQPLLGYRCLLIGDGERDYGQYDRHILVEHAPTCCVLAKRNVFPRIGLMDERYFVYHDDSDFMLRALKAGLKTYLLPDSRLLHKVSSLSGAGSDFQIRFGTRNRALMLVKFCGRILSFPYIVAYRILYLMRFLLQRDDYRILKLKQDAWTEGSGIPKNFWPI